MKIKGIINILLILYLLFYSFYSFSQTKPALEIYDSTKVCDGYIVWMSELKSTLIDRKGNLLYNFPGNLLTFFNDKENIIAHSSGNLIVYNKDLEMNWKADTYIHHEIVATPNNDVLLLSQEYKMINSTRLRFDVILRFDSTGKQIFRWAVFENRKYLLDFIMNDTSIFRYKINGSSDPDSVLFKLAPSLRRCGSAFHVLDDSTLQARTMRIDRNDKAWFFHEGLEYPTGKKNDTNLTTKKIIAKEVIPNKINKKEFSQEKFNKMKKMGDFGNKRDLQQELFHVNWIQLIPTNNSEKKNTVFRKGNVLLSFNNFNDSIRSFIAIVDPVKFKILWYYVQTDGRGIHTPHMLPNGHILVYVNYSLDVPFASVNEIDPITKKVTWSYVENFPDSIMDNKMGSCQRLSNGNTLISNHYGYIYEVTPEKEIVWKYNIYDAGLDERVNFYKAILYPKEKLKWLINEE